MSRLIGGGPKSRLIGGDLQGLLSGKLPVIIPVYLRRLLASDQGNMVIRSVEIVRVPIEKQYAYIMGIVSRGAIPAQMQKLSYDDLLHLYVVLTLANGVKYICEKNQRVVFKKGTVNGNDSIGPFPVNRSLRDFFENARIHVGGWEKLMGYDPSNGRTCQDFVLALLGGNNLLTYPRRKWVRQDLKTIMETSPKTSAMVSAVISVVGLAEALFDETVNDIQTLSGME
jgi:hypothetical protein